MERASRGLIALASAAALAYLLLSSVKPYPGDVVLKTAMCVLLAVVAARHRKWLLTIALVFSALGDALLAIDGEQLFVPALASFLATHLFYAAIFVSTAKLTLTRLPLWRIALLAIVPLFAIVYTFVLWPHLGALTLPVTVYVAAIATMTMLSLRVPVASVPIGAVSFLVSDSLIALDKFLWREDWVGPAIWITYAVAQVSITLGLVGRGDAVAAKR